MIELLQVRHSPYNEKVRWALDAKRVPHRRRSLLPGPHMGGVTTLTGTGAGAFGYDVDGAGDVDADGYPDVLVGEPGTMCVGGEATIYFGGSAGLATTASRVYIGSDGCYGMHLAGAGDVNGDATDDLVVGAYSMSSTTGEAYI